MQSWFTFELNSANCRVEGIDTHKTLAQFLADRGTWPGGRGFSPTDPWAGGDPILMASLDGLGRPKFRAVDAGLLLLPMAAGQHLWTWDAVRLTEPEHPVVKAVQLAAAECGPRAEARLGILLLEGYYRRDLRRIGQVREQLDGVVSRTANWRAIERIARAVFAKSERNRHEAEQEARSSGMEKLIRQGRIDSSHDTLSRQLVAFFPENDEDLSYVDESKRRFYRPQTLVELLQLKKQYPDAQIIAGGTGLGLYADAVEWPALISTEDVAELRAVLIGEDQWEIGAAASLTSVGEIVGRGCAPFAKILKRFASRSVRNRATLGGYLGSASAEGQIAPLLIALDARVHLASPDGERDAPINQFYTGDGKTILRPGELIRSVTVPRFNEAVLEARGSKFRLCDAYITSRRRGLCEPFVTGGFAVEFAADKTIRKAWISYSGVSDRPVRARKAENELAGRKWNEKAIMQVLPSVIQEIKITSNDRGDEDYRRQLIITLFQKFFYQHPTIEDETPIELGAASEFAVPAQPFFDAMQAVD
ncbi:MAG: hypothetical protein HKN23_08830 [Verrucomicrobiales bacterium]|nr:hypothetical protein [Verrucomicrobiales bacterium]